MDKDNIISSLLELQLYTGIIWGGGKGYSFHHCLLWIFHIKHFNKLILSWERGWVFFRTENYNFPKFASLREWTKYFGRSWVWVGFFFAKIIFSFLRSRSCHHLLTDLERAERMDPKKFVCPCNGTIPVQCAETLPELYPAWATESSWSLPNQSGWEKSAGPSQRVSHRHFRERECGRVFTYCTRALNLHS